MSRTDQIVSMKRTRIASRSLRRGVATAWIVLTVGALHAKESRAIDWMPADVSFDAAQIEAATLAPSMPSRIYIAPRRIGVYRSDDLGETWLETRKNLPLDLEILSLAVDPSDPDRVYAGASGPSSGGSGRIFASVNAGGAWVEISSGIDGHRVVALLPRSDDPEVILAGLQGGDHPGVYRTTDRGATWSISVAGLGSQSILCLAESPIDPDLVLAGTDGGAARSTDGGQTWTPGTNPGVSFQDLSWSEADPSLVYAASGEPNPYRSTDGGGSFGIVPGPPEGLILTEIAAHPEVASIVYAGVWVFCEGISFSGTVWQSLDQGAHWSQVFFPGECGGEPSGLLIDPDDPEHVYLAQDRSAAGFWRAGAGGWTLEIDGIRNYSAGIVRSDHQGGVYARDAERILRTSDPAGPWTHLPQNFYAFDLSFEANYTVPSLLHEVGSGAAGDVVEQLARRSTNGGSTWSHELGILPSGLPFNEPLVLVASNHGNGQTVYVWSSTHCYRSDDGHESYVSVSDEIAAKAAVVDPSDSMRLYAAQSVDPVVSLSTDGGVTWTARGTGLPEGTSVALFLDPLDSDNLVVVLNGFGAYETTNGGLMWTPSLATAEPINDAAWDPIRGNLYLATAGAGVLTTDLRVTSIGLPTHTVLSVTYSPLHDAVIAGTQYAGVWIQEVGLTAVDGEPLPGDLEGSIAGGAEDRLRLSVFPNPTRSGATITVFSHGGLSGGDLVVRSVAGRLVRRLGALTGRDRQVVSWDGHDEADLPVPAGVYFVQASTGSKTAATRILIVR
jgi:photosystem II stability/assembly factor-like uncharacterized protein